MIPSAVGLAAGFQSNSSVNSSRPSSAAASLMSLPPTSRPTIPPLEALRASARSASPSAAFPAAGASGSGAQSLSGEKAKRKPPQTRRATFTTLPRPSGRSKQAGSSSASAASGPSQKNRSSRPLWAESRLYACAQRKRRKKSFSSPVSQRGSAREKSRSLPSGQVRRIVSGAAPGAAAKAARRSASHSGSPALAFSVREVRSIRFVLRFIWYPYGIMFRPIKQARRQKALRPGGVSAIIGKNADR